MESQSFTVQELCAINRIACRHEDTVEVEVKDWRPEACCLTVKVFPSEHEYCLDDLGQEIDAPVSERDGLPVVVFSVRKSAPLAGGEASGGSARVERRRACSMRVEGPDYV